MSSSLLSRAKTAGGEAVSTWVEGYYVEYPEADGVTASRIYPHTCGSLGGIPVDPDTIGRFTGFFDRRGRMVFEGDILRCEVMRLSGSSGSWSRKTNEHHGKGYFITMYVYWFRNVRRPFSSRWSVGELAITSREIEAVESPVGRERVRQHCNYFNFGQEDIEVIGNVWECPREWMEGVEWRRMDCPS